MRGQNWTGTILLASLLFFVNTAGIYGGVTNKNNATPQKAAAPNLPRSGSPGLDNKQNSLNRQPIITPNSITPTQPLKGEMKIVNEGKFLDPNYKKDLGKQHLGTDYKAGAGTSVYATRPGTVVENINSKNPFNADVIVQNPDGSREVYGHVKSDLKAGTQIKQGQQVGTIRNPDPNFPQYAPHLHYGENTKGIVDNPKIPNPSGWGWGQAPSKTQPSDIKKEGWIDPQKTYGWGN